MSIKNKHTATGNGQEKVIDSAPHGLRSERIGDSDCSPFAAGNGHEKEVGSSLCGLCRVGVLDSDID